MLDLLKEAAAKQPLVKFETRCDDKGRIRLPANWLHFFTHDLKDNKVFTTSLDGSVIRIYAESIWRYNLALFEEASDHSAEIEHVLNLANHYGTETDLDANGRILINSDLRSELGLLGDLVVGVGKKGVIHVYRKEDHDAIIRNSKSVAPDVVQNLTRVLGMR